MSVKGFKGFGKNLGCGDIQFEIGKTFEIKEGVHVCREESMFFRNPHSVFSLRSPEKGGSRFCVIEAEGTKPLDELCQKETAKKITIKREIDAFEICAIAVPTFFENFGLSEKIKCLSNEKGYPKDVVAANAGDRGVSSVGRCGAANAGERGAANAGERGAANAGRGGAARARSCSAANVGDYGAASAGSCSAVNAGHSGAALVGRNGVANAMACGVAYAGEAGVARVGDYGVAMADYGGMAFAGEGGAAKVGSWGSAHVREGGSAFAGDFGIARSGSSGYSSVGHSGVAIASTDGWVRGGLGSILVLINRDYEGNILGHAVRQVDGDKIKADTWYRLDGGEFVEIKE